MDAYVIWTLQDQMTRHERRIHDAGKRYAQHVQSTDLTIVAQAEGVFLQEMRDSIGDVLVEMRRRTPDPIIHAQEHSDGIYRPARMNLEAAGAAIQSPS